MRETTLTDVIPLFVAGLLPVATLGAAIAVSRVAKWYADRDVVVTTTQREHPHAKTFQRVVSAAAFAVVLVWIALGVDAARDSRLGVCCTFALAFGPLVCALPVAFGKSLIAAWRFRRRARLQARWERWLDSADSCQVGPRKWTK